MEVSNYKDEFISEARDYIDILNEALLVLEKDPSDEENINKLFRAFHTLKGNAATMGYKKFSELAHSLEDVLSKIRDKEMDVSKEIIDHIFEGCDILETGLEDINNDHENNINSEDLVMELHQLLHTKIEKFTVIITEKARLNSEEENLVSKQKKQNIFRMILIFDPQNAMKSAKTLILLRNLSIDSKIIRVNPDQASISAGKFETEIEIIIATDKNKEQIKKEIESVSGISKIFVLGLDESYVKPESALAHEKEAAKFAIAEKHSSKIVKEIQSVKVSMKKLDKLMNLVGELLISDIRLQETHKRSDFASIKTILTVMDRIILDLQDEVMEVRMVPIGNIFNRFPRMVRDLASKEAKDVNLVIEGAEIEFDRTVLDRIGDPLVHILRNSVDHGIESPQDRARAGKPEQGTIKLIAKREKNHAEIEIVDDGQGIDPELVKNSSIKKGIISKEQAEKMSEKELQMLVFRAGVSTNETVTDVSGRGVGMDVVSNNVKDLGGSFTLDSVKGKGTNIKIQLPLTVAIITGLLVRVESETYIIPLVSVDQTISIQKSKIKTIQGNEVLLLRSTEIPIFWLHGLVGHEHGDREKLTVVVVHKDGNKIGLIVDEIISQQQVLIKSLQDIVKGVKGTSGASILGDGRVALILDIDSMFENS